MSHLEADLGDGPNESRSEGSTRRQIAVVHMDLMAKGGGEAVCMNVLEALQDEYDLTLLTLTEPDIPALNEYFNTDVDGDELEIRLAGRLAPTVHQYCGLTYYILQNALLGRYARRKADEFDLMVSTINELGLGPTAIQYIHFPFDWAASATNREEIFHPTVANDSFYERLCTHLGGIDRGSLQTNTLFANSDWTADVVEDAYDVRPEVLHPPVDKSGFTETPWEERESGFVTVGRIERSKRIAEQIEIIDRLRHKGHAVHLHVIGPTVDEDYHEEVANLAATRPYVELEGEVDRSTLVERICSHRYGLHAKEYEHFGMAVAELAAGGAIPFVPANGGPGTIVDDPDHQTYHSVHDAVDSIEEVLTDPDLQRSLRSHPNEIERRFGCDRFQSAIRAAVRTALDRPATAEPEPVAEPSRMLASDPTD